MRLFLVRHGTAEEKAGRSDPERALTDDGRSEVAVIAALVAQASEAPLRLLSSPYLRAEQTAEILREALEFKDKITPTDALLPDASWAELRALLQQAEDDGVHTVVAVGHNPSISQMVARIIAGEVEARVAMAKGAAACLEVDDLQRRPAGELKWLLTPRALQGRKKGKH